MANIIVLKSLDEPGAAVYSRLTEAQLRNRLEPEKGIFIAESPKVINTALDMGCTPISILTEPKHIKGQAADVIERCGDIPVYTAERELLSELTGYALTRGVLCAFRRPTVRDVRDILKDSRRIAVLDNIADSVNVGAVFRSAAALGMDNILVTSSCCDPLCRRAVRVSMGAVLQIPWATVGDEEYAGILHDMGFSTAAMALCEDSVSIDDPVLVSEERIALILGSEGYGLPERRIRQCRYTVRIPMSRGVDSLNVAAAAAVAFWTLRSK